MKQRLEPEYRVILNNDVTSELQDTFLILRSKRQEYSIQFHFPLVINGNALSLGRNSSDMDQLMFLKFTRQLLSHNVVYLELLPGLNLEYCPKVIFDDFLKSEKAETFLFLSPGVVIETFQDTFRLTDTFLKTVVTIKQELFYKALAGSNLIISNLSALKIFNHKRSSPDEMISSAFHFHTTRSVDVIKNENHKLDMPWHGTPKAFDQNGEFLKVLAKRKSAYLRSNTIPSLKEISTMLQTVYGTKKINDDLKFFYPAPGAGYSVRLIIVHPDSDQESLYEFDPIEFKLSLKQKGPSYLSRDGWVRIYLVGDLTELKKKYQVIPYRLMLLEAGVILQQISLAASFHNLSGRIIGHTSEAIVKEAYTESLSEDDLILGEYILTNEGAV